MIDYLIVLYIELIAAWRYSLPILAIITCVALLRKWKVTSGVLILLLVLLCMAAYQFETFK
jgi:hypothetical protein